MIFLFIFSCKDTALQVLMSNAKCLCVYCPWTISNSANSKVSQGNQVPRLPKCSPRLPKVTLDCMQFHEIECISMSLNTVVTWSCMQFCEINNYVCFYIFGSDRSPRRGDLVRACERPCIRPSVRPCVRPSVENLNRNVFSETIWPTVTKFGMGVVCGKGLKMILHSVTLTEGQGRCDLEKGSK